MIVYAAHPDDRLPAFFADVLRFADKRQHVVCSEPRVKARIHDGAEGTYLWVTNSARRPLSVRLELAQIWGPFAVAYSLWGVGETVDGRAITLTMAPATSPYSG